MRFTKRNLLIALGAFVALYLLAAIGYRFLQNSQKAAVAPQNAPGLFEPIGEPITAEAIYNLVNEQRQLANVPALSLSPQLTQSASNKCSDMVAGNYYGHVNPSTGKQGYSFALEAQPDASYTSESLNQGDVRFNKDFVNSWLESPAHKAAMLDPKYNETGLAICEVNNLDTVVEHFAVVPPKPTTIVQPQTVIQQAPRLPSFSQRINCTSNTIFGTTYTNCF